MPVFSILGIIINVISIIILNSKNTKKELSMELFNYVRINFKFNLAFCILSIFKIPFYCITVYGNFCPDYITNVYLQYFDIYTFKYFINVLKFCCIFTEVAISYSRYVNIDKISLTNNKKHSKKTKFTCSIMFLSMLLNLIRVFSFRISDNKGDYPFSMGKNNW